LKKLDLNQIVTLLANLGVIAGIVFLGFELRQNNQLLQAQARTTRMEIRREASNRYLENPDLVPIVLKNLHGEALTDEESFLLDSIMFNLLVIFQYTFVEFQQGLIDEQEVPVTVTGWRGLFHNQYPALPEFWDRRKGVFRQDFVDWFEENVVNER